MSVTDYKKDYERWLHERPVDWQRFKKEDMYAEMLEDEYLQFMFEVKHKELTIEDII